MNIACIGEVMIELSMTGDSSEAHLGVAGDTFNTAVYLKRAGREHHVAYLTVLGTDAFSDRIVQRIAAEGIDTSLIVRRPDRVPGLYAITTDPTGERSFTYWRDRSAARLLFDEATGPALPDLAAFDVIYYSAITLAILPAPVRDRFLSYLDSFRALPDRLVVFDSNYRARLWESVDAARHYTSQAWRQCDIALPSMDDEMALFGDVDEDAVVDRLASYGITRGALKRGSAGPLILDAINRTDPPPGFAAVVDVVDSTAAGDSFNGAYLAHRLSGADADEAAVAGHACASQVIRHRGAIVDLAASSAID